MEELANEMTQYRLGNMETTQERITEWNYWIYTYNLIITTNDFYERAKITREQPSGNEGSIMKNRVIINNEVAITKRVRNSINKIK